MNMRSALLLALAAIDADAQFNTTAPTVALSANLPTVKPAMTPNTTSSSVVSSLTPSKFPSKSPSISPSKFPSNSPSSNPSNSPTSAPSDTPSSTPTDSPSDAPSTSVSPSGDPTNAPSNLPTSLPSTAPTLSPSTSNAPSASPTQSSQPTPFPTVSFQPTSEPSVSPSLAPTISNYPSFAPTVSAEPSGAPSVQPSGAPIIAPSAGPSLEEVVEFLSEYTQQLTVTQQFDKEQVERFCRIYTRYTLLFGYEVVEPQIYTKCNMRSQLIGYTRRKLTVWNRLRRMLQDEVQGETSGTQTILTLNFFMKYSTKIGVYDLTDYNSLFTQYVNSNIPKVLEDMNTLKLPVLAVADVIELEEITPTDRPTLEPTTEAPVLQTQTPSAAPSIMVLPTKPAPPPGSASFVMGLSLGLIGAFVVAAFGFVYYRHTEKQKQKDEYIKRELSGDNNGNDIVGIDGDMGDSLEVKASNHDGVLSQEDTINDGVSDKIDGNGQGIVRDPNAQALIQSSPPRIGSAYDIESGPSMNATVSSSVGSAPAAHPNAYATMDSVLSQQIMSQAQSNHYQESFQGGTANFMMADASFSSDSEDELVNPSAFDGSHDELDNYKNNDLEILRDAVEEAVDDVEGMLSLAMTQALTESEDATLPWGSEDSGSIEASCLFEAYDWLKRNEESPLDTRNEFFQEVINNIVITVLFGLMHPFEAAQLAHGVATVIGLPLLKELPKKTLVITGMRKTTDVDRGQHVILSAFERFGPIEAAAITPNNRGFGFVRFSKPKSVQRALEKYRVAEIEIQNVSVSIKTL